MRSEWPVQEKPRRPLLASLILQPFACALGEAALPAPRAVTGAPTFPSFLNSAFKTQNSKFLISPSVPLPFYLCCLAICGLGYLAFTARWKGWGLPMGMVLVTTAVWYVGDAIYNDYAGYRAVLGDETVEAAWWQVLWFLILFGVLAPLCHRWMNGRYLRGRSHVTLYLERQRSRRPDVQHRIDRLAAGLFLVWGLLMVIALLQVRGDMIGLFAPYLGQKADPWSRGQFGGGFSAFISLAAYLQIFLAAAIGVVAALARTPRTQLIALTIVVLAMPYYIFDRTRNTMLATMMPGILAFVLMRLRLGWGGKVGALAAAFLVVNAWMLVVSSTREGMKFDISKAIESLSGGGGKEEKHAGLNMFEELSWIHYLSEAGVYEPDWGARYFAELVNPIPRGLWKNKPSIGLDYALARGQMAVGPKGETTATISTGMIGQGVVNFGPVFGPAASALLMALWVALLARQDLLGANPGRIVLYGTGIILTFNIGRDITLLVLYPFFFGLILFHGWMWWQRSQAGKSRRLSQKHPTRKRHGPAHRRDSFYQRGL